MENYLGYRKRIFLIFVSLILTSACRESREKENTEATEMTDSVRSGNMLIGLNERISKDTTDAEAYYSRAKLFLQRGILQQAFQDAGKAVSLDSGKAAYYLLLADISFRGLQIHKAVQAFERCLQLEPDNMEANLKLSELYMYLKAYPKSIDYANAVLRIDNRNARAYFIKGFVYKESGDTARAVSSFTTAVEMDPDYYDAYIQLGLIYGAKGNDLAIQYYSNALKVRPGSEEALYNRGFYYQEDSQLQKAEEDYQAILAKNSSYKEAWYNLGFIELVNRKNYPAAIKNFSAAINIDEHYVEAYYNRGLAYEFSGDMESAIKDYRAALNIFPNYGLALDRLELLRK